MKVKQDYQREIKTIDSFSALILFFIRCVLEIEPDYQIHQQDSEGRFYLIYYAQKVEGFTETKMDFLQQQKQNLFSEKKEKEIAFYLFTNVS